LKRSDKTYTRIQERVAYSNNYLTVFDDDVEKPEGSRGRYVRIRYQSGRVGIVVVPRRSDGKLFLINVPRYSVQDYSWEFPRGTCDAGEAAASAAKRELFEETGLRAQRLERIGKHWPDGAIMEVEAEVFVAAVPGRADFRSADARREGIRNGRWYTLDRLWHMVGRGTIRDGFTLGAMALYNARTLTEP
jgi:ADP-ribose pyrophosphatase